jgi:hypothetical protein
VDCTHKGSWDSWEGNLKNEKWFSPTRLNIRKFLLCGNLFLNISQRYWYFTVQCVTCAPDSALYTRTISLNCLLYHCVIDLYRREIIYCKRTILSLSSSKILTPRPPLRPASVYPPPLLGGRTHSPGGEGDGGSIFWKTREIGLPSFSKQSLYNLYAGNFSGSPLMTR